MVLTGVAVALEGVAGVAALGVAVAGGEVDTVAAREGGERFR